jgi:hypothetical protein
VQAHDMIQSDFFQFFWSISFAALFKCDSHSISPLPPYRRKLLLAIVCWQSRFDPFSRS